MRKRCPLCYARDFAATDRYLEYPDGKVRAFDVACRTCGLLADLSSPFLPIESEDIAAYCSADPRLAYGLDPYSLRLLGLKYGQLIYPESMADKSLLERPHASYAVRSEIVSSCHTTTIAIAAMCKKHEADSTMRELQKHSHWADELILLVDSSERPDTYRAGSVQVVRMPFNGDFGARRTVLQTLARSAWVLQVDADETLDPGTLGSLHEILGALEQDGVCSVGFPRSNYVEGQKSDLYPDIQYRLNRKDVRYENKVHERPIRHWHHSVIMLGTNIVHNLTYAHVSARSQKYEQADPGKGRLFEQAELLKPFCKH